MTAFLGLHWRTRHRPRLQRGLRPTPDTVPRLRTLSLPIPTGLAARSEIDGPTGWFPRSPDHRLVREVPSSTPAASPRLRRRLHRGLPTDGTKRLRSRPHRRCGRALQTGPYPPGWSRLRGYGASGTGSLTLHLLTSLNEPAPSGSTSTARLLGAAYHRSPSFPMIGCPDASSGRCDDPHRDGLAPPPDTPSASWRTAPPRRNWRPVSESRWLSRVARKPSTM